MADVYAKIKREGNKAPTTGNLIVTDDANGLFADINDSTTIKFAEDGTAYIDLSDGKEPAPLSGEVKDPITERKVYNALPSINGSKDYDANTNLLVPTELGKEGQVPTMRGNKLVFEDTQETHSHENKGTLDIITATGDGDKFLSNDGTYKEISIPDQLGADGVTVKIENDKLVAIGLDGLETTIATLNFIKNLDKDIMDYIRSIGNPMKFKGVVETDDDLNAITTHNPGDMYIVRNSASNDNKKMSFVSNGTIFEPVAETEVELRDFYAEPIDLAHEVSGVLPASNIDPLVARKSDIPNLDDVQASMHSHSNKGALDNIINTGNGDKYLTDNGIYKEIPKTDVDTVMKDDSTNPVQNKAIKKYVDDAKVTVDDAMKENSTNPVQNKVAKAYVDELKEKVLELTNIKPTSVGSENALSRSENGLFVKDLMPTVNRLNYAQKTCRDDKREWIHFWDGEKTTGSNYYDDITVTSAGVNIISKCSQVQTTLDDSRYSTDRVSLKAGISYEINVDYAFSNNSEAKILLFKIVDASNPSNVLLNQREKWVNNNYHTIFTATEDINIAIICRTKHEGNTALIVGCSTDIYIKAVEPTVIDPVEYVDHRDGLQDNPVGTVIAYMGTTAPAHYLLCDGSEYQITDYPYLAQHIKDNFGAENYWGGDGIETFATPDLRAEFLRGAGEATRQTGAGANVGQHQDPTTITTEGFGGFKFTTGGTVTPANASVASQPVAASYSTTTPVENNTTVTTNVPQPVAAYSSNVATRAASTSEPITADKDTQLSIRPTATSVNFCIKAEPTYYLVVETGN